MSHDWMPNREQDLVDLMNKWSPALADTTKRAAWDWSPSQCVATKALLDAFFAARADYLAVKTQEKQIIKERTKKSAVENMRDFANKNIRYNDLMQNEEKLHFGIHHDDILTPHPAPEVSPGIEALSSGKRRHTITAINPATNNKKKPDYVTGVAFGCKKRDRIEPKAIAQDLPSEYQTSATRHYQWDEADLGKVVDYATAYERSGSGRGPWSDIDTLIMAKRS